jgi:hypothetical protein
LHREPLTEPPAANTRAAVDPNDRGDQSTRAAAAGAAHRCLFALLEYWVDFYGAGQSFDLPRREVLRTVQAIAMSLPYRSVLGRVQNECRI